MGKLVVIVGGQFGSEAKGAVAAFLARHEPRGLICCRVAGPNAGHSVVDDRGRKWALRHLPVGLVVNPRAVGVLAAGSEIDLPVLAAEISELTKYLDPNMPNRVIADDQATLITSKDAGQEAELVSKIGSTGKGIGAARAHRIMRTAETYGEGEDTAEMMRQHLRAGGVVHVEGTQGFGLGLHAGYYPFCTSSDCRAIDFLAMAGLSPWAEYVDELEIWVVLRTHPIRVAGNSGPLLGETSWEELGLTPEYTTVTGRMRRVGKWDPDLARMAIVANGGWRPGGPVKVALTFMDYIEGEYAGRSDFVSGVEGELGVQVSLVGLGPSTDDYIRIGP